MIKLIKFGAHFGVPDPSPFVLKLETYLRLAKIDYAPIKGDVRKAPKGKFPILIDGDKTIADSQFCIDYLKETYGDPLNEGVSSLEKAHHHMLRLGLENETYFTMVAYRWLHENNSLTIRDAFFSKMGLPGKLIFKIVRKKIRRDVMGHGVLRHSWEEIDQLIKTDIDALETLLGDDPFFGGHEPKEIDCTTFAFIANMIVPDLASPFRDISRQSPTLIAYHNRMSEMVFADYKSSMIFEAKSS